MSNTDEQVEEHKKMVLLSGNISKFQLENLKRWPFIVFGDQLESVKINFDFANTSGSEDDEEVEVHAGSVCYDFKFKKGVKISPKDAQSRLSSIIAWTKYLFWSDTQVSFKKGGRKWTI